MKRAPLTIICYHYVRDLRRSRYPAIKGCELARFEAQLDYLDERYSVVTVEQVLDAMYGDVELPPHPALLTFDDGYLDHYTVVFPRLHDRGWQGCFFAPGAPAVEGRLLDVNKIHFILASATDIETVVARLQTLVLEAQAAGAALEPWPDYLERHARAGRWDPPLVVFVKRMLQNGLPGPVRTRICQRLFEDIVGVSEETLAAELYCSAEQLRLMRRSGMYLGAHGYHHRWMDELCGPEQDEELDRTLSFLRFLGVGTDRWIMGYPYGRTSERLVGQCRSRGCVLGVTTQPGVAELGHQDPLRLPRADTNDLPP